MSRMAVIGNCCHRSKLRAISHELSEEELQDLAATAHGFVGADLAALTQEASLAALRRVIAARASSQSASAPGMLLSPQGFL